ncbi:MAG: phosphoenolpyruvate carboxykinase (ATP), partial [Candidatus Wallbacteria bacterium]|nr:phosphoenolpyruvate carboxykinase (ATP) [Candidatus Wallbacteria bacterium]
MLYSDKILTLLKGSNITRNPSRRQLIEWSVQSRCAIPTENGSLAVWTRLESTGRSPKDTYLVMRDSIAKKIDWTSANNLPLNPVTFNQLVIDALKNLSEKDRLCVTDRVLGADPAYALPVTTISPNPVTALFTDNMFLPVPKDIGKSIYHDRPFFLLVLPDDKLDQAQYKGLLRELPGGRTSNIALAIDFENMLGVVFGSAYCGSVKKLMFTVMNFLLPESGILPLHCSANESMDGSESSLFLGLSGTGKTTLSADPKRLLIGDDEHGWSDSGIANFEGGCYAKLIGLNPLKEPDIFQACFHTAPYS